MDGPDKDGKNDTQKAKLIFLSLAGLVTILLVWSLYAANRAKTERDAVRAEFELLKQDNAKLEQILKDQNQEINALKTKVQQAEARARPAAREKPATKAKAKPAAKKKKAATSSAKKSARRH
jgi:hypothetical protein